MHGCSEGACVVFSGGTWFFRSDVHGFCWEACMVFSGGHAWFFPGGMHGFFQGVCVVFSRGVCVVFSRVGMCRIRRDTVNERAVRILLECILVQYILPKKEIL